MSVSYMSYNLNALSSISLQIVIPMVLSSASISTLLCVAILLAWDKGSEAIQVDGDPIGDPCCRSPTD